MFNSFIAHSDIILIETLYKFKCYFAIEFEIFVFMFCKQETLRLVLSSSRHTPVTMMAST